jgi:hypothetical protein
VKSNPETPLKNLPSRRPSPSFFLSSAPTF